VFDEYSAAVLHVVRDESPGWASCLKELGRAAVGVSHMPKARLMSTRKSTGSRRLCRLRV
jgi:hypothetical protein